MKGQIPWLRVFVEGVVIVGSILLALALDAWWDERQERAEEQEILRGLEADFVSNLEQLRRVIRTHQGFDARLVRLDAMTDLEVTTVAFDSLSQYLSSINVSLTFDARDGTLDGVIGSGKLALIRDVGLRDMLVEWKSGVEDAEEEAGELRDAGGRALQRMGELGGPWSGGTVTGPIAEFPSLSEARSRFPPGNLSVVVNDPGLMGLARVKRARALVYLMALLPLAEHADSVLVLVEANRR